MTNISIKQTTPHISIRASGKQGIQGKSAYDIAVEQGFVGTEADWIAQLATDAELALKADKANTYTKTEVDTALTGKANTVHTHVASDVTDFNSSVSSNADVSANTAARHTHANKAILDATSAAYTTADETKLDGIEAGAQVNTVTSVAGKTGAVTLDKTDVGLSNVDNTSDANKSISTATQTALDAKLSTAQGDARYANSLYAFMPKSQFSNILSAYGLLGQKYDNSGYVNDLVVYGLSTQAGTPTPDAPVPIVSTTGNVTVKSDSKNMSVSNRTAGSTVLTAGITYTVNADGSVTANGTSTGDAAFWPEAIGARTIRVFAGVTYTIQSIAGGGSSTYYTELAVLNDDATNSYYTSTGASLTFTPAKSGMGRMVINIRNGVVANNMLFKPQLEVGSTATAFEKNTNSTQTLPLGTTQLRSLPNGVSDRIYKSGSSWFLEQNVGESVLTSGLIESYSPAGGRGTIASVLISKGFLGMVTGFVNSAIMSNKYITVTNATTDKSMLSNGATGHIWINDSSFTSLAVAQGILTGSQILVQLSTPVTTTITDPTLITALENIRTYQGVTNITASTPVSGSYGLDTTKALAGKVDTTGNQTVAGVKTFTSAPIAPSGTSIGGVLYLTGTGFPNGVIAAPVGSIYIDTSVTNGASSWIKKSGTGNTGWQVLEGDTGWRNITALSPGGNVASGNFDIRRKGDTVLLRLRNLAMSGANATMIANFRGDIGTGFEPGENISAISRVNTSGVVNLSFLVQPASTTQGIIRYDSGSAIFAATSWACVTAWPTTLPGTAF